MRVASGDQRLPLGFKRAEATRPASAAFAVIHGQAEISRRGLRSSSGGARAELKFPAQIFIGYIDCSYGAHEHIGGVFAKSGSQVLVCLCSESAESDRIDYYALPIHYLRVVEPACVPSSPNPRLIWPSQPRCG